MQALLRLYCTGAYFFSWLVFGAVGLAFNLGCAALLLLPDRKARAPAVRRAIRWLFARWVTWLRITGLFRITWSGTEPAAWPRPAVYVANHPSLIDATLLLARIPDAICVFKPELRRNPVLAPAAIMAGYVSGDGGLDLIHELAGKIGQGANVLIFPEGTRTSLGVECNPLKAGFALIARRAGAPVQIITIRADRDLLPRGRPWWRLPRLPSRIELRALAPMPFGADQAADEIVPQVRGLILRGLGQGES